jgi:hypothetical protein
VSPRRLRAPSRGLRTAVILLLLGAACNHVQPHLELPALQTGGPAFQATLEAYTGAAVVPGNRVDILLTGEEIFPAKLAAIRAARRTITYAQYVFEEGEPAADTARALADRCLAGVKVHVLLDAVGGRPADAGRVSPVDDRCGLPGGGVPAAHPVDDRPRELPEPSRASMGVCGMSISTASLGR